MVAGYIKENFCEVQSEHHNEIALRTENALIRIHGACGNKMFEQLQCTYRYGTAAGWSALRLSSPE